MKGIKLSKPKSAYVLEKFIRLEDELNAEIYERKAEVHCLTLAILARKHFFMVGPPGTAKSLLITRATKRIGDLPSDGYFHWLMTRHTTPDEVFGPVSLAGLKKDEYRRVTTGKLPKAPFVFLDEIFKSNSSILNACLTAMNERKFFNGPDENPRIPLISMFGASNEMPQGEELNALWDRLHFRFEVKPLQETSSFMKMLTQKFVEPEAFLTLEDIEAAHAIIDSIEVPLDMLEAIKLLREQMTGAGVLITERRWVDAMDVIRAEAFLNGHEVADIEDLRPLAHMLWSDLEHQRTVRNLVIGLANPLDREAMDLIDGIIELNVMLDKALRDKESTGKSVAQVVMEVHGKIVKTKKKLDLLKIQIKDSGRKSKVVPELEEKIVEFAYRLNSDIFKAERSLIK
jgi:MoxR-like ATPase